MIAAVRENQPTHEDFVARARGLGDALRERIPQAEAKRMVPEASIQDLKDAGLFRLFQPARWGGAEAHPSTFFDVQMEIGAACASTAWVFGVVAVHSWQLALFPLEAQEEVWADDADVLISSSYAPTGKVEIVDGGYRISGRWSFSSGCDHCDWAFLGGFVPPREEGGRPDMRTFLLPKKDYSIEDTWHVIGLKGTGSKDVVVDNVFVPEHRTHRLMDGFKCKSPGNEFNQAPLYRLPFGQVFVRSVSTTAIGNAQGALDFYKEVTKVKVGAADGSRPAKEPTAQLNCARAASTLRELRMVLHQNMDEMMAMSEAKVPMPIERRVAWRYDSSNAVHRSMEVVDGMFTACGGRALFLNSPMHRFFLDAHAARAHYANNPLKPGLNFGRVELGLPTQDYFI